MAKLKKSRLLFTTAISLVFAALFLLQFSKYMDQHERDNIPNVIPKKEWKPWMNALEAKLFEDPNYHIQKTTDKTAMVLIPAGDAYVGCKENCTDPYPTPYHRIHVDAYYIDKKPVTAEQYNVCVEKRLCLPPILEAESAASGVANLPVLVDYPRAERYCRWIGKRLPTEFEWEKAARGTEGILYPWGNDPPDPAKANICDVNCAMSWSDTDFDDGYATISPVGAFPAGASPFGLLDVAGNVKEWVSGKSPNPEAEHIAKGSSWYSNLAQVVIHSRQDWRYGVRLDDKGVRCAAEAD